MSGLGEKFKKRREELGLTLEEVEDETKIRKHYLEALEQNRFESLPARVYAVGFVQKYARLLGLNEQEAVQEFKELAYKHTAEYEPELRIREKKERFNLAFKNILTGLIFLFIVVWIGGYLVEYMTSREIERTQPPQQPKVTEKEKVKEKERQERKTEGLNLLIKAEEPCWISATADGQEVFRGLLNKGEEKAVKAQEIIHLVLGNAGGVKVELNGEELGYLGSRGEVVKKDFTVSKMEGDNSGET